MGYIRLDERPSEVYHYTHRKNLDSILRDVYKRQIRG